MSKTKRDISKIIYNDRYGYAVAYYEPHMRDPGLEIIERSKKYNVPRVIKYRPEKTNLWKLRETPSDFLKRKNMEREIEVLHDTCEKAKTLFRKARDFDYNRHEMLFPKYKNSIETAGTVDDVISRVNRIYEKHLVRPEQQNVSGNIDAKESDQTQKPDPLIMDSHNKFEHLISKRREDALHDVKNYSESIDKIYRRIERLMATFNEDTDDE